MLNQLFNQIVSALDPSVPESKLESLDAQRVSAMLLVEIARSDHVVDDSERKAIENALLQSSSLLADELGAIVDEALIEADNALSFHNHVSLINEHFSKEDKIVLIEQMWRVAFADGNVDGYEEYTIRKLCDLLYVKHRDYMQAKIKISESQ